MLIANLGFSQNNQKNIDPDKYYVEALYKHIVKANQAYIEVKHRRVQMDSLQSILVRKDLVIKDLLAANNLSNDRNRDYQESFKAMQIKVRGCEDLQKKYDFANTKLMRRQNFMQIGTPVLVIGVGVLAGVGGYYLNQIVN